MARTYVDVELEWGDDGVARDCAGSQPPAGPALEQGPGVRLGLIRPRELRRVYPLALFVAGVLLGTML